MRDAYNSNRRRLVELNEDLNCKVLELSFSGVVKRDVMTKSQSAANISAKIQQLKTKFENSSNEGAYSKALSEVGVRTAVVKYLEDLSSLLSDGDHADNKIWVMLNQHNFNRAAKMLNLFQVHENKYKDAKLEIDNFTDAVNTFLNDSGKIVGFDEDTGDAYFINKPSEDRLSLHQLSSGEKQIVIILSYFAFLAKQGIPIIIDEPELSLHVKWQKDFVAAVKQVMPPECQTIMATHSPEICGATDVNVQAISVRGEK